MLPVTYRDTLQGITKPPFLTEGREMTVNLISIVEALTALAGLLLSVVTFTMAR